MARKLLLLTLLVVAVAGIAVYVGTRRQPAGVLTSTPAAPGCNVLLVTIDTLRADRVGRGFTPALDALAARGLSSVAARTVAPLTLPAHVSLMTGVFPPVHGVRQNGTRAFDGRQPTLARVLHAAGYQTAAFVAAYVLDRRFGLNDGFDVYDDDIRRTPGAVTRLEAERPADLVADRAISWLQQRTAGSTGPFFAWVHFYDAHAPYNPPPEYLAKAHGQPYDGEVAFVDSQVGRLLAALDTLALSPRTLVVVVGDHGESLGEHGENTHGMLLFDGALRVPLIAAGPGIPHVVRQEPASLVDVAPTLLQLLGQTVPDGMKGVDLVGAGRAADERRQASGTGRGTTRSASEVYSETEYPAAAGWSPVYSVVEDRWKLVEASGATLFDLQADPGEQHDVAGTHESLVRSLRARLGEIRAMAKAADHATSRPPAEVANRLRSLGYVASATDPTVSGGPDPATVIQAWTSFEDALGALAARDYRRAVPLLDHLAAAFPDATIFETSYIEALQESGNVDGALAVARRAVTRHPREATVFHALAVAARDAHRVDEAMRAEQAASVLDPADPAVDNGIGLLNVDLERFPDAVTAFQKAVNGDPTNAEYWTNLGNAQRAVGALSLAETAYRRALDLDPAAADAANGVGVLLVQGGKPADAIPWFERALRGAQDFYEARLNLGIACQRAGDSARAARTYRQVLQAPPRFAREREGARKLLETLK